MNKIKKKIDHLRGPARREPALRELALREPVRREPPLREPLRREPLRREPPLRGPPLRGPSKRNAGSTLSSLSLLYIINHVFLPPKLPRTDDSRTTYERALIRSVKSALEQFLPQLSDREDEIGINRCIAMVDAIRTTRDGGEVLSAVSFEKELANLEPDGTFTIRSRDGYMFNRDRANLT
jgi:hypothetical protein